MKWLYDSIKAVKVGATTRDIASKWPSAKEAWGYEEEDQAAANLWGHGLGLAQYDQPVISRIWSLDHPIEIKEGMVFALETQHGKPYQWGVRIEEMLIVHKDSVEIVSNFPVEQITVVDPMPGYSDYGKREPGRTRALQRRRLSRRPAKADPNASQFVFTACNRCREATDAEPRLVPRRPISRVSARRACRFPAASALDAEAYRTQIRALGLEADARGVFSAAESPQARRHALAMKLGLLDQPITPAVLDPLLAAWHELKARTGALTVVRSSALVEDRFGSSFAGQFESFLGIESEADFITAIRSCWGALWATRALRYMATHDIDPADTAMGVLVQPLVSARASGGGLSQSADGNMILSATWGLGSAIAQGEVTPDRYELSRDGKLLSVTPGRKDHQVGCIHRAEPAAEIVPRALIAEPCLSEKQATELGRLLRRVEELMGMPVEIEWAMDDCGFQLLQARPLHLEVSRGARCRLAQPSAI